MDPTILKAFLASVILTGPFVGLLLSIRSFSLNEPPYLLEVSVEPVSENDWQNLFQLLLPLAKEIDAYIDQREQMIFIQAMNELVVESISTKVKNGTGMEFKLGDPEVFYYCSGISLSGNLLLWEAIMKVEVAAPKRVANEIERELLNRRGRRLQKISQGGALRIIAFVPLEDMFGFSEALRAISEEKVSYITTFDYFSPLPPDDEPQE